MMKRFSMICALALMAAGPAGAAVIPVCPAPAGAMPVGFDQLPMALQKALHDQAGDVALPGQPFEAGDVVTGKLPRSRGIFAWNRGVRWVVATERGGRAYSDPIYAFDVAADGKRIKLTASRNAVPGTVCARAGGLLDGK